MRLPSEAETFDALMARWRLREAREARREATVEIVLGSAALLILIAGIAFVWTFLMFGVA